MAVSYLCNTPITGQVVHHFRGRNREGGGGRGAVEVAAVAVVAAGGAGVSTWPRRSWTSRRGTPPRGPLPDRKGPFVGALLRFPGSANLPTGSQQLPTDHDPVDDDRDRDRYSDHRIAPDHPTGADPRPSCSQMTPRRPTELRRNAHDDLLDRSIDLTGDELIQAGLALRNLGRHMVKPDGPGFGHTCAAHGLCLPRAGPLHRYSMQGTSRVWWSGRRHPHNVTRVTWTRQAATHRCPYAANEPGTSSTPSSSDWKQCVPYHQFPRLVVTWVTG